MISAEELNLEETCPRRAYWSRKYEDDLRVSLVGAMYKALRAGLLADDPEKAAENKYLELAANPGLDIEGHDVYAAAMHHAKLASIIAAALRSTTTIPWKIVPAAKHWESACYDIGDGIPRRIVLVDRWTDTRRQEEIYGWRTMGETCSLDQTIYLTAITIGQVREKKRHSPWTKCYLHPVNAKPRLKKKNGEFGSEWLPRWREDAGIPTKEWLEVMHKDGCMTDLVHTVEIPVPMRRDDYLVEINRLSEEAGRRKDIPEMRLSGCFGFHPCQFLGMCHGPKSSRLSHYGFKKKEV